MELFQHRVIEFLHGQVQLMTATPYMNEPRSTDVLEACSDTGEARSHLGLAVSQHRYQDVPPAEAHHIQNSSGSVEDDRNCVSIKGMHCDDVKVVQQTGRTNADAHV